jgi:Na+-translocating ferredoxin:NAD+ oxidoreductase RnfG subunit
MKRIITMAIVTLLGMGAATAQQPTQNKEQKTEQHKHGDAHGHGKSDCGNCPHHMKHQQGQKKVSTELQYNADGIEATLVRAFPTVKNVNKTEKWTEVYDSNKKLLGYAVYSKPASDGIKGYNGETPVLIALSPKKEVLGVYLLPNLETPKFAKRVEDAGFFKNWNGLSIKKAISKEVDAVSGATFTSTAVAKSVRAALEKL